MQNEDPNSNWLRYNHWRNRGRTGIVDGQSTTETVTHGIP